MQVVKLPVKGGIQGHISTVPIGKDGIIWACNVFPQGDKGVLLWRPRLQVETENTDYASIYDPDNEVLLDAECIGNAGVFLIYDGSNTKLKLWKPGSSVVTYTQTFPAPSDGATGQIKFVGKYLVVGIEGKGLYVIEFNSDFTDFDDWYRIGSIYYGYQGTGDKCIQLSSANQTLLSVSDGDRCFIGTITVFLWRPDASKEFSFKMRITDATTTYESDEFYSNFVVATGLADFPEFERIWTPVTFTFNVPITPPFDIVLEYLTGTMDMYVEAAGDIYNKSGYTISYGAGLSEYPHLHINGSLDPDGGIVAASRGMIAGVYDGNKVQFASLIDFTFQDEVVVENDIIAADSYDEGMIVLTSKHAYNITGWSHDSVTINKIGMIGVTDYHNVVPVDKGVIAYSWGMVDYYSGQGISSLDLPFLYDLNADSYVSYLPSYKLLIVGFKNYHYSLVISLKEKWVVWWRWDEIGEQYYPLASYGNVMVFSDGKAYIINSHDNTSWESYRVELLIGTGFIQEDKTFACFKARANVGLFIESSSDASIGVLAGGKNGLQVSTTNLSPISSPISSLLPDTTSIFGIGVPYQIPYQYASTTVKPKLSFLSLPALEDTTATLGASKEDSPGFPTGNSFLFQLVLEKGLFKHPGYLLDYVELTLEEVSSGITG